MVIRCKEMKGIFKPTTNISEHYKRKKGTNEFNTEKL